MGKSPVQPEPDCGIFGFEIRQRTGKSESVEGSTRQIDARTIVDFRYFRFVLFLFLILSFCFGVKNLFLFSLRGARTREIGFSSYEVNPLLIDHRGRRALYSTRFFVSCYFFLHLFVLFSC